MSQKGSLNRTGGGSGSSNKIQDWDAEVEYFFEDLVQLEGNIFSSFSNGNLNNNPLFDTDNWNRIAPEDFPLLFGTGVATGGELSIGGKQAFDPFQPPLVIPTNGVADFLFVNNDNFGLARVYFSVTVNTEYYIGVAIYNHSTNLFSTLTTISLPLVFASPPRPVLNRTACISRTSNKGAVLITDANDDSKAWVSVCEDLSTGVWGPHISVDPAGQSPHFAQVGSYSNLVMSDTHVILMVDKLYSQKSVLYILEISTGVFDAPVYYSDDSLVEGFNECIVMDGEKVFLAWYHPQENSVRCRSYNTTTKVFTPEHRSSSSFTKPYGEDRVTFVSIAGDTASVSYDDNSIPVTESRLVQEYYSFSSDNYFGKKTITSGRRYGLMEQPFSCNNAPPDEVYATIWEDSDLVKSYLTVLDKNIPTPTLNSLISDEGVGFKGLDKAEQKHDSLVLINVSQPQREKFHFREINTSNGATFYEEDITEPGDSDFILSGLGLFDIGSGYDWALLILIL